MSVVEVCESAWFSGASEGYLVIFSSFFFMASGCLITFPNKEKIHQILSLAPLKNEQSCVQNFSLFLI